MKDEGVKLFVPSDLALPYTVEERTHVQVPRDKYELELKLKENDISFVVVVSLPTYHVREWYTKALCDSVLAISPHLLSDRHTWASM